MADKNNKVKENVSGKFYVDNTCIGCGVCIDKAQDNFKLTEDNSHAFVFKQPNSAQEEEKCEEARVFCPADAIGDDGE